VVRPRAVPRGERDGKVEVDRIRRSRIGSLLIKPITSKQISKQASEQSEQNKGAEPHRDGK
jgi:hypothetical protein